MAVEVAGGPSILFEPGRKDSLASPEEADFPASNYRLSIFHRMGLTGVKDIVALTGGLTLERAYQKSLEREETSCVVPIVFDNSYFVNLLSRKSDRSFIPPEDGHLLRTPDFLHYVRLYAKDKNAFFRDYGLAHKKFSEFGLRRIAADNIDQELKDNPNITINKSDGKLRNTSHSLVFYGTEYLITSASKPSTVTDWAKSNLNKSSKTLNIVGIGPIWEAGAEGPPKVIAVCLNTKRILVYEVSPSGQHIPKELLEILKEDTVRKITALDWDKKKLKNFKSKDRYEKFIVTKLSSVKDLMPNECLSHVEKPITLTTIAQLELMLSGGFEISDDVQKSNWKDQRGLDEDQITAASIKAILAHRVGETYRKSLELLLNR